MPAHRTEEREGEREREWGKVIIGVTMYQKMKARQVKLMITVKVSLTIDILPLHLPRWWPTPIKH